MTTVNNLFRIAFLTLIWSAFGITTIFNMGQSHLPDGSPSLAVQVGGFFVAYALHTIVNMLFKK